MTIFQILYSAVANVGSPSQISQRYKCKETCRKMTKLPAETGAKPRHTWQIYEHL